MAMKSNRNVGAMGRLEVPYQNVFTSVPLTVSIWVKMTTSASTLGDTVQFCQQTHGVSPWKSWALYSFNGNDYYSAQVTNAAGTPVYLNYSTAITTGVWFHMVLTIDASVNSILYVNGISRSVDTSQTSLYTATSNMSIGGDWSGGGGLDGFIDDMRFYNRVLSAAEVATLYGSRGQDNIVYGLISRWTIAEGAAGTVISGAGVVKDLAGNYDATPYDSPNYEPSILTFRSPVAYLT